MNNMKGQNFYIGIIVGMTIGEEGKIFGIPIANIKIIKCKKKESS